MNIGYVLFSKIITLISA